MIDISNLKWHKLGIWIRPGTGDEGIPGEQKLWENLNLQDKVVLDIGGHIGCFAVFALNHKAKYVVSIEPHPDNAELFEYNLKDHDNVELIEAAVVSSDFQKETIELYCTSRKGTSTHSLYSFRGRKTIKVPVVSLKDLLETYNPETVKLDAEGLEYMLQDDIVELFPKYGVQSIGIELHGMKPEWHTAARKFVKAMSRVYEPTQEIDIVGDSWISRVTTWELI